MAWVTTSKTCVSVYGALDDMNQFAQPKTFEESGPMAMQELQFFISLASGDLNAESAMAIAMTFEGLLNASYAGQYKTGVDANKAITKIVAMLEIATKTVAQLAEVVDTIYIF
ncbi:hypothetical protein [Mucilaginibacter boryungensis]|uniref:Uncharacterized protein n=1 Tax=Mucilaginibacter boryungensis TaxID=768480 RepID=A0ABR9XE99_9SPHI|nr:hypothetical protein [Mucilaginibacter boryungensis]MBE9665718.1 hypothetical protein [Mucilaginibacter boryungensis]